MSNDLKSLRPTIFSVFFFLDMSKLNNFYDLTWRGSFKLAASLAYLSCVVHLIDYLSNIHLLLTKNILLLNVMRSTSLIKKLNTSSKTLKNISYF